MKLIMKLIMLCVCNMYECILHHVYAFYNTTKYNCLKCIIRIQTLKRILCSFFAYTLILQNRNFFKINRKRYMFRICITFSEI